jgi:hypothetical protein
MPANVGIYYMKYFKLFQLILLLVTSLVLSGCKKSVVQHRFPSTLIVPESAEYFGCRINGALYNPSSNYQLPGGTCTYQLKYKGNAGYSFEITGDDFKSGCHKTSVGITLDSIAIEEGKTYMLGGKGTYKNYGSFFSLKSCAQSKIEFFTKDNLFGYITITKFDPVKRIIKGNFQFTVSDANGSISTLSDGVFDRHYTQ